MQPGCLLCLLVVLRFPQCQVLTSAITRTSCGRPTYGLKPLAGPLMPPTPERPCRLGPSWSRLTRSASATPKLTAAEVVLSRVVRAAPAATSVPLVVLVPQDDELVKTEAAAPGLAAHGDLPWLVRGRARTSISLDQARPARTERYARRCPVRRSQRKPAIPVRRSSWMSL